MTTVSNVSEITATSDAEAGRQFGPMFGAFVRFGLGQSLFSIQPEVLFTAKGAALDTDDDDPPSLRLNYLEVPLLVKLTAPSGGDAKALYVLAGPTVGFKLSAAIRSGEDDSEEDIDDRLKGTDFGITLGGGLQGRRWLVEGRYTEGLVNVAAGDADDPVQTRMFAVLVGIRF